MHPRAEFGRHYAIPGILRSGYAAFGHNSRYLNNDTEAIHERLLLGNSGGASLFAYYQAQATLPPAERDQDTPGGSRSDLTGEIPPGDGFVALAAPDRTRHDLAGADYYLQPTTAGASLDRPRARFDALVAEWMETRFAR